MACCFCQASVRSSHPRCKLCGVLLHAESVAVCDKCGEEHGVGLTLQGVPACRNCYEAWADYPSSVVACLIEASGDTESLGRLRWALMVVASWGLTVT